MPARSLCPTRRSWPGPAFRSRSTNDSPPFRPSYAAVVAAQALAIDLVTLRVVGALSEQGMTSILLKGPSFSEWLYGTRSLRTYSDIDLLVSPDDRVLAEEVLGDLGFAPVIVALPGEVDEHGYHWAKDGQEPVVDLHTYLVGAEVSPANVWAILSQHTEHMELRGTQIEILDEPARALHAALHAAQHGATETRWRDLEVALQRVSFEVWKQAASLAEELAATGAFLAGLRLVSGGAELAARLRLQAELTPEAIIRSEGAPSFALGLEHFLKTRGVLAKVRLFLAKMFPPTDFLRAWSPSLTSRGRAGIVVAYVWRPLCLVGRAVPGTTAWFRARRRARRSR